MIACVAVVGPKNNPLYLSTFLDAPEDELLQLHTLAHCALDAVEERVSGPRGQPEGGDAYLGLLSSSRDLQTYGYVTNTQVKLLAILDGAPVKDEEIRMVFRRLHTAYVGATANPFYTPGTVIASPAFDASARTIVAALGGAPA